MSDFTKMSASDWWKLPTIPTFRAVVAKVAASSTNATCEIRLTDQEGNAFILTMYRREFEALAREMLASVERARDLDMR